MVNGVIQPLNMDLLTLFFAFKNKLIIYISGKSNIKYTTYSINIAENTLDIVNFIENNPITKLSNTYQNKLLTRIQSEFTEFEQQLFVTNLYCFLNYRDKNDFIIDLDKIWKWLGFQSKFNSKRVLEKNFMIDTDYTLSLLNHANQTNKTRGGHNKETFLLSVKTFKSLCLKAGTKQADNIHEYYIKLEEILNTTIAEELSEIKQRLTSAEKLLETSEEDKCKLREKTIIEQFPKNTQCFYYGIIDNVSDNNEKLIKFGNSNNLKTRVTTHHKTYHNFHLINAFKVKNKLEVETIFKEDSIINPLLRTITISSKKYIELLSVDELSFNQLDKIIQNIISKTEYTYENYIKLQDEIKLLKQQLIEANTNNSRNECILLTNENKRLEKENHMLIKKCNSLSKHTVSPFNIVNNTTELPSHNVITSLKRPSRNKEGKYNVNGVIYDELFGTREQVFYGTAYKTKAGLTKNDISIDSKGKFISKLKSYQETLALRFEKYGINPPSTS